MTKKSFPLAKTYTLLEPGPVTLVTTLDKGKQNIMAMSWHTMMEFEPPQIGCILSNRNHSFGLLKKTRECVINIPTAKLAKKVVAIGNCHGDKTDKFRKFCLTSTPAALVKAPLIEECYASLECRVIDSSLSGKYGLFVLEVVKAWVDPSVKNPKTLHHRGYGKFMVAGKTIQLPSKMK
jgi:flavin reductase (DIM6/NTAB) family NADH-FMN oxidoreductase RutF